MCVNVQNFEHLHICTHIFAHYLKQIPANMRMHEIVRLGRIDITDFGMFWQGQDLN